VSRPDRDRDWRHDAACRDTDPEAFFPLTGHSSPMAKAVCGSCEVQDECLDFAMETRQPYGIWGGRSEAERAELRRAGR
jgi:WhiB family redox-sensing transcriptional regulator